MTTPPGDGRPPEDPHRPQPGEQPTAPYGQPGYGPPAPYGQPPGYPPMGFAPDHPKASTALVLGILGLVLCQLISPFAWQMGKRTVAEIDAAQGRLGGRGAAQAGYVCGLIGTILLAVALGLLVVYLLIAAVVLGVGMSS